ncbi:MAG: hypothetical protein JO234_04240 [Hyphomicrobiales bacterium]|nr:hypothetical protein [Hyphomicrobiales bacterium]
MADEGPYVTEAQVLACHDQFGALDKDLVKAAMGPNWPKAWDKLRPGESIFGAPDHEARKAGRPSTTGKPWLILGVSRATWYRWKREKREI